MGPKLDAVILATGDGDFVPAVEYLRTTSGCQVEAISFGRSSSSKLKDAVDEFVDMDENIKRYTIKSKSLQNKDKGTPNGSWGTAKP